jgi:di/tricarboxylate transporter
MEQATLSAFKELGIAIFSVGVVGYLLYRFMSAHAKEMTDARLEREKTQMALMSYIETNNHQKTEMIKEHTQTNVEVRTAIEQHNKLLEKLVDKIN